MKSAAPLLTGCQASWDRRSGDVDGTARRVGARTEQAHTRLGGAKSSITSSRPSRQSQ